jgi:hypothetical protein
MAQVSEWVLNSEPQPEERSISRSVPLLDDSHLLDAYSQSQSYYA